MPQLLTASRAAHLIGISRATLQKHIRDGDLPSFDGMVSTADLLRVWPDVVLEDSGAFEKIAHIRDDAFAKRLRERVLPTQEVLAQRLFEQGQEMAELRRHLTRYHRLVESLRARIEAAPKAHAAALAEILDAGLAEVLASPLPDAPQSALDGMDAMLRVMSAHVTVKPSGREFFVDGSESLLTAALRAGLTPAYGCGNGNCGLCKARVIDGEVRPNASTDYVFTEQEKAQGHVLMCSCTAASSELLIEVLEAGAPEDIPEQRLMTKVRGIAPLSPDVIRLHLQTPRTTRLRFLAGQRVTLGFSSGGADGDSHGEYPIASCPCDDRNLIFHISRDDRRPASADFSARLFAGQLRVGQDISVWGPWGDFVLGKENAVVPRPLLFAAIDAGFAPINSLIEHAMALDTTEPITLVWASAHASGLYLANQCRAWVEAFDNFRYLPVVAADPAVALADALLAMPLRGLADIYLCGQAEDTERVATVLASAGQRAEFLHVQGY